MTRAIKGILSILVSLAIGAILVATGLVAKAKSQTRYDADQKWIRQTLHKQRHAEEAREAESARAVLPRGGMERRPPRSTASVEG